MEWVIGLSQLTVTGGKGGTGKSFVAVNLALLLAESHDVVLADLDLEEPNDHILLGIDKLENEEPIKLFLPFIDVKMCTSCGVCAKVCDTGAILMTGKLPIVFPRLCSGCMTCYYACPYKAITGGYHILGYIYTTKVEIDKRTLTLVTGVLHEGEEHTPPGVNITKRKAFSLTHDVLVIDTSAGTGNHVSIALLNSNLVIIVTEPTPLGLHDMESILKVTSSMGLRIWLIINRDGIGDATKHVEIASKYGAEKIYRIPYHRDVVESYVNRRPIVLYKPDSPASRVFHEIARDIEEVIDNA